jgi:hypothetical protein
VTAYLLFFVMALIWMIPKVNLYYTLEATIEPMGVVIADETARDEGFGLKIDGAHCLWKGMRVADVEHARLLALGIYNRIDINTVTPDEALSAIVPFGVESLVLTHSLAAPLHVSLDANGRFGTAEGVVFLSERRIELQLFPSTWMGATHASVLKWFEKDEEGVYRYAASF